MVLGPPLMQVCHCPHLSAQVEEWVTDVAARDATGDEEVEAIMAGGCGVGPCGCGRQWLWWVIDAEGAWGRSGGKVTVALGVCLSGPAPRCPCHHVPFHGAGATHCPNGAARFAHAGGDPDASQPGSVHSHQELQSLNSRMSFPSRAASEVGASWLLHSVSARTCVCVHMCACARAGNVCLCLTQQRCKQKGDVDRQLPQPSVHARRPARR